MTTTNNPRKSDEQQQPTLAQLLAENSVADSKLSSVCQLVFREDAIREPTIRLRLYEFILLGGGAAAVSSSTAACGDNDKQKTTASSASASATAAGGPVFPPSDDDDDDDDHRSKKQDDDADSSSPIHFKPLYAQYKNTLFGCSDEAAEVIKSLAESAGDDVQKLLASSPQIVAELCGVAEHIASRLEFSKSGAAQFVAAVTFAMFLAVVMARSQRGDTTGSISSAAEKEPTTLSLWTRTEEQQPLGNNNKNNNNKKRKEAMWGDVVFRLSFQFCQRHKCVLSSPAKSIAYLLMRLVFQYHLPELVRHCDQHTIPVSEWVYDNWILKMFKSVFFFSPSSDGGGSAAANRYLSFFDFVLAARDPLILFAAAAELLTQNQSLFIQKANNAKEAKVLFQQVSLGNGEAGSSGNLRSLFLRGQQQLRSTPRCAKNRLRHYIFGTKLLHPLPGDEQEQQPAAAAAAGAAIAPVSEKEKYEGHIVLPISNRELVEAFSIASSGSPAMSPDRGAATAAASLSSSTSLRPLRDEYDSIHCPRPLTFVVLDCRSEKSFHFARLPTAIHVGSDVGYDPELMQAMLERFEGARGSHICVFGTGRGVQEETNLLKVIALRFVQGGFPFVSIAEEGFKGLIPLIKSGHVEAIRSNLPPAPPQHQKTAPPASSSSSSSQQQQQQSASGSAAQAAAAASKEALLKKAEAASEAAAKWGKNIFSKLSSWSLTSSSSSSSSTAKDSSSDKNAVAGRDELSPGADTNSGNSASGNNKASAGAGTSSATTSSSSSMQQPPMAESGHSSSQPFRAGGVGDDDDDDDELLSELVTTIASAPAAAPASASAPAPASPAAAQKKQVADELVASPQPSVPAAATTTPASQTRPGATTLEKKEDAEEVEKSQQQQQAAAASSKGAPTTSVASDGSPHPFDDMFD